MAHPAPAGLQPRASSAPLLRSISNPPATQAERGFTSRAAEAGVAFPDSLASGLLAVDLPGYVVTLDGEPLDLSPRQVELLALFLAAPRKVWSRDQLHW